MSFDWSKYLEFAKKQDCKDENGVTDEAACRASISRAYYAAFCSSRNYLCKHGDITLRLAYNGNRDARRTTGPIHEYVIDQFALDPRESDKLVISETLKSLKARRIFADYKNHHDRNIETKVQESLLHAQNILDDLKNL